MESERAAVLKSDVAMRMSAGYRSGFFEPVSKRTTTPVSKRARAEAAGRLPSHGRGWRRDGPGVIIGPCGGCH